VTERGREADALGRAAAALGLEFAPDAIQRLRRYVSLLETVGADTGVVARSDVGRAASRHVADSLRAAAVLSPLETTALDLGSGGGLPGIPVAIAKPDVSVGLVESRRRRVGFLELACDRLAIANASPLAARIEALDVAPVDVCFARALAPLVGAWSLAMPLLRPGGRLVYFAGAQSDLSGIDELGTRAEVVPPVAVASGGPLAIIGRP
jgi:16S rRNA (guanine527-N7)-methyltransferase